MTFVFEEGLDGYTGFEDTTIYSESENAGGGIDGVFSGTIRNSTFHRRALIRVDLSEIPPGSIVNSASLEMVVSMSGGNFGEISFSLFRLSKPWGEGSAAAFDAGGIGADPGEGDATWISNRHASSLWETPGGDFEAAPSAMGTAARLGSMGVWSGAGMAADVQTWIDDPASNFGWILISDIEGENQRVKKFFSSEASDFRPRLTVVVDSIGDGNCCAATTPRPSIHGISGDILIALTVLALLAGSRRLPHRN